MKIASMILIPLGAAIAAFCFICCPLRLGSDLANAVFFGIGILLFTLGIVFLIYSLKAKK